MDQPLIKTKKLKKYFKTNNGFLHAVDGVDLEVHRGKTLGIVGESGCGKSTLGRCVLRLIEPTEGEVLYEGKNILSFKGKETNELRKKMQIIFQDPFSSLNPRMSVYDLIGEPLKMNHIFSNKKEMSERILYLMEKVGLAQRFVNAYPHEMDGGRRQRVGVARDLAMNPKFIVCDEPVSALDVSIQAQILNMLMDLQEEMDMAYMFITHDLSVVKHISDEIAVMYLGQCVERASAEELFANPMHPYTQALLSAIPVASIRQKRERSIIRGEVANPINPEPGCRFAARCDYCTKACRGEDMELLDMGNRHYVACCLFNKK